MTAYSLYVTSQITGLRELQRDLADRNRQDSLQLLRIQNDLNSLGLAMRDMLDADEPYPLTAWSAQFDRIRLDLENALRREQEVAVARRTPEQQRYLATSLAQFWDAADRIFALARDGQEDEARVQIRLSLQARQAALSTAVARLLVENNESEEQTAERVQEIYDRVQRQVYWFLTATLVAIVLTSLYLIRSNRRLFAELALALGPAERARATADRRPRVDAPSHLARAARRVRPDSDGDGRHAGTRRQTRAGRLAASRRAARESASWRSRRSTTSAACRRRCTRRSSTRRGSRARSNGICRPSRSRSASPSPTSGRDRRCR